MVINVNTKITTLLKSHPDALETIISISPKFSKLRNPILRKVIAGRTSIAMASKLGGCTVDDFFDKLQPLGFTVDRSVKAIHAETGEKSIPVFMERLSTKEITELDVRSEIEKGRDPLDLIMSIVKNIKTDGVLKIINSFEPTPLVHMLEKQGFESYMQTINEDLVHAYFHKKDNEPLKVEKQVGSTKESWDEVWEKYKDHLVSLDVRNMQMPMPMHSILDALENLPLTHALFVYHKRIPVFLLPELEERKYSYGIKEISDAEVHLLIYQD